MKINVSKVRTRAMPRQSSPLLLLSAILLIATIAAAILLLLSRKQPGLYFAALLILIPVFNLMGYGGAAVYWALLLMLVSAIGLSWNIVPSFLPKPIRIPVLNLAAALFTLMGGSAVT